MTKYRQRIIDYIQENARPRDKFSHQPRLYALAVRLAGDRAFDDDVVFAAAWMHDLGVFAGHRPEEIEQLRSWDHLRYAEQKVPALLQEFGFPAGKIQAVMDVIGAHLPQQEPGTFEGLMVRDADILEQLGAVGILRTVSKVGRDTRFAVFEDAVRVLRRNMEELPGQLRLESARALAVERIRVMREFLASAVTELNQ